MGRKVNGIEIETIVKIREHSPETKRLNEERNKILQPGRTRIVGKGSINERVQCYRTGQRGRKAVVHLNNLIYDRLARYCESIGSTPSIEIMKFNRKFFAEEISDSDDNSAVADKLEKCPTTILRKYPKHHTVNFIKLRQYARTNGLNELNEKRNDTIKRAEKEFTLDLHLLSNETTKDQRIISTIRK